MFERYGLSDNYISVGNQYYGGSQMFFGSYRGILNSFRKKGGCGIVALSDILSYLKKDTHFADQLSYVNYFKKISHMSLLLPTPMGLSFLQILSGLKLLLYKENLDYHCFWCFSRHKLYSRIKTMLINNIPVLLCIPKSLGFKNKDKLNFYDKDLNIINSTNGHFVVITGICEDESSHKLYLRISSWGHQYFISYEEYVLFSKKHILGLLGNIMYIFS